MYTLGQTSLDHLSGVHPSLVRVEKRAIELTRQDFGVHEGVRTLDTQRLYFARGVSKTMDSKHLKQSDGYGHAVDNVPYLDGKLRWEWPLIFPMAKAVQAAAIELNVPLRWGAVWDRPLAQLSANLEYEVEQYKIRHSGPDFLDGPHFELM